MVFANSSPLLTAAYPKLDRHMFCLMWGPTVAAVSVVLDHASDPLLIRKALDGFLSAAKIASFHHVDEARFLSLSPVFLPPDGPWVDAHEAPTPSPCQNSVNDTPFPKTVCR